MTRPRADGVAVAGIPLDLIDEADAVNRIASAWSGPRELPLAVASVNLDHVHHFGPRSPWEGALRSGRVDWLDLADGAPIVRRAAALSGLAVPRLAGSDLIGPVLDRAESEGVRVGFLGGSPQAALRLREGLRAHHPGMTIAGIWTPPRSEVVAPRLARALAERIRDAAPDLLVVGLGKPRQELWIDAHGPATGARVLLAFGAVVDFLGGGVSRAPAGWARHGMEWAWRLALEPRRLARRYLVHGPPAWLAVQRRSLVPASGRTSLPAPAPPVASPERGDRFITDGPAEVAAIVVTYNSAADIDGLIASLRHEARRTALRVIVADNSSTDGTVELVRRHPDVTLLRTGGNLGYSGGINAATGLVAPGEHLLIVNPDLQLRPGAVRALLERLATPGVGIVAPAVRDERHRLSPTIRREPTVGRALGDALLGRRWTRRPTWLSDIDWRREEYEFAHPVDWASGAALLVRAETAAELGPWDESFFLYSEETDYQRRARAAGWSVWFEPAATVRHVQGGSGSSASLVALNEVNRVRYVQRSRGAAYAALYGTAVTLHSVLRVRRNPHRSALRALIDRRVRSQLPRALRDPLSRAEAATVRGSVIIPAHDEAAVIERTLNLLRPLLIPSGPEVLVVCNGCRDDTAARARTVPGVRVVELPQPSKAGALAEGDRLATSWPRLYLDADIAITPRAVADLLRAVHPEGAAEAARPQSRYDTEGASRLVRSYYAARARMPSLTTGLWGAGAYVLSERGHARIGTFPGLTADDLYVDRAIPASAKVVVRTDPVVVRTPRTAASLARTLRRVVRGNDEQGGATTTRATLRELAGGVRSPRDLVDALVYAGFALAARRVRRSRPAPGTWERDDSARIRQEEAA